MSESGEATEMATAEVNDAQHSNEMRLGVYRVHFPGTGRGRSRGEEKSVGDAVDGASWGNGDSTKTGHGATPKSFVQPINTPAIRSSIFTRTDEQ